MDRFQVAWPKLCDAVLLFRQETMTYWKEWRINALLMLCCWNVCKYLLISYKTTKWYAVCLFMFKHIVCSNTFSFLVYRNNVKTFFFKSSSIEYIVCFNTIGFRVYIKKKDKTSFKSNLITRLNFVYQNCLFRTEMRI